MWQEMVTKIQKLLKIEKSQVNFKIGTDNVKRLHKNKCKWTINIHLKLVHIQHFKNAAPNNFTHFLTISKNTPVLHHLLLQGTSPTLRLNLGLMRLLYRQADSLPRAPPGKQPCMFVNFIKTLPPCQCSSAYCFCTWHYGFEILLY